LRLDFRKNQTTKNEYIMRKFHVTIPN